MEQEKTGEQQKENNQDAVKPVEQPEMQYVVVQLADGRRGVFVGPVLVKEAELILSPPRISEVMFSKPMKKPSAEEQANGKEKGTEAELGVSSGSNQEGLAVEPKA